MSQRLYYFLVVFMLMFCGRNFAQQKTGPQPLLLTYRNVVVKSTFTTSKYRMPQTKVLGYNDCVVQEKFVLLNKVPASFNTTHLGFFCKKELQLDKVIAVPFRFRLGSLAYVNYLEQKPNAVKPQQ